MTVKLAQVLSIVDDALKNDRYEDRLCKIAEYDVTFCALDYIGDAWKGNVTYKVATELEVRDARFAIDAESGHLRLFTLGHWDWEVKP